ncbi:MAG TPA: hypothetical protein VH276_16515 [Solirubrobacteraceae bacterium]|jgi:hypothetical protein|nr:hypothetical protein [Solirubrobacteraceae bacterium]
MLARLRRRATFANVTSALALFVALGGTSYAAITLPANSVGSDQIRTGAVGTPEIRTGGVGASEIKTSAVRASEIKTGGVGASEIHTDAVRAKEIKSGSVANDELAADAVTGPKVKDGSLEAADLSDAARSSLAGNAPFRSAVNTAGTAVAGNATGASRASAGVYTVDFGKDVSACFYSATLAAVKNGTGTDAPTAGSITVEPGAAATSVTVRTFAVPGGAAADEPFHLGVSC